MMSSNKILIFGNSGSGKSTLARALADSRGLAHLDLDTLAWLPTSPPQRAPLADANTDLQMFIRSDAAIGGWVIEGCYTDLLGLVSEDADQIIFMNLPVEACIANAQARPWEPHKYISKAAQDENLDMLLGWIAQYVGRDDEFSHAAHLRFYEHFDGPKTMLTQNAELADIEW
jgi:adenylate kinase family enzyme